MADKDIKKFTYFIAFVNFCLKIVLAISLSVNETKKNKKAKQTKFDASRKTLFNEKSEKFGQHERSIKAVGGFFQGKNPFSVSNN